MLTETDPFDQNKMEITFRIYAALDDTKMVKLILRYKPKDFQKSNYTLRIKSKIDLTNPINSL